MSELLRAVSRFAIIGAIGGLAAGCSSDAMRFSSNPFSNPFSSGQTEGPRTTGSVDKSPALAPMPHSSIQSAPLAAPHQTASAPAYNHPAASHPAPVVASRSGAVGWSVDGGTPITVADGDSLSAISNRYGVPSAAILSANGVGAAEIRAGRRIVIPVYSASGSHAVAHVASARVEEPRAKLAEAKPRHEISRQPEHHARAEETTKSERIAQSETKAHPRPGHLAREEHHEAESHKLAAAKAETLKPARLARAEAEAAHAKTAKAEAQHDAKTAKHEKLAKAEAAHVEAVKVAEVPKPGKPSKEARKVASLAPVKPVAEPEVAKTAPAPVKEPEATGALPAAPSADFRWPARGRVITGFGGSGSNEGINISVPDGTPVKASEAGVVAYAGSEVKGYGNLVLIRHDNGYVSAYAHNGELDVKRGQKVTRGQTIARSGQSGNVTSPQLHFEIRKGSTPVDPMRYLASN